MLLWQLCWQRELCQRRVFAANLSGKSLSAKNLFWHSRFPFTANPRHRHIRYDKGICPVCEDLDENKILITAIMQPQTIQDMHLFGRACEKMMDNSRLLNEYGSKSCMLVN